jgi:hypothetical protein
MVLLDGRVMGRSVGAWNGGLGLVGDAELEGDPGTDPHLRDSADRGGRGGAQRRPQPLRDALRSALFTIVRGR